MFHCFWKLTMLLSCPLLKLDQDSCKCIWCKTLYSTKCSQAVYYSLIASATVSCIVLHNIYLTHSHSGIDMIYTTWVFWNAKCPSNKRRSKFGMNLHVRIQKCQVTNSSKMLWSCVLTDSISNWQTESFYIIYVSHTVTVPLTLWMCQV